MAMEAFGIEPRKRQPRVKALPYPFSALEIPEILECIFGFLAPSQIRFGPRLVCKLWRTISFSFSGNVLSWETSMALPESSFLRGVFENRLRSTSTLHCTFKSVVQLTWDATRKALCTAINNLTTKEQQQIRELHYIEDGQVFKLHGDPFKPLHITTLHVSACRLFNMDIDVLWSAFPHLRVLSVWNTSETATRSNLHWKKPPSDSPHNLKLRSLRLRQVSMAPSLLHTLLRYCPELNELKLVEIEFSSEPTTATKKVTFKEHLDAIVNLKPSLETFHFSMVGVDDTPTKLQAIASIASAFPCLKSLSVLAEDLNIPPNSEHILLGLGFTTLIHQLTTLELLANPATDSTLAPCLQSILCNAPNLLHLKAQGVSLDPVCSSFRNTALYPLWACCNLQTLHVRFEAIKKNIPGPRSSRMFFAYLVKCCPRLVDININHSDLDMTLEGGICLLSELKDLEKLVLYSKSHPAKLRGRDLDWLSTINPRNQSIHERLRRKMFTRSLKVSKQDTEDDLQQQIQAKEYHKGVKDAMHTMLRLEIWEAGTLAYVDKVLKTTWDRQLQGVYCWPHLEKLHLQTWCALDWMTGTKQRPHLKHQERMPR
jgi:hypothetical protein